MREKQTAHALEPAVWIGKAGLTEQVLAEIKKQLKNKGMIKIKMLKPFVEGKDKKRLAQEIAAKADARLVYRTGFVLVLAEKKV